MRDIQVMRVRSRTPKVAPLVVASTHRDARVSAAQRKVAARAIAALPAADRALLRKLGLKVELIPKQALEDGMLGATSVVRAHDGRLDVTRIRIASKITGRGAESLREVVQHEVGHAISVLRTQDDSEDAAEDYARRH